LKNNIGLFEKKYNGNGENEGQSFRKILKNGDRAFRAGRLAMSGRMSPPALNFRARNQRISAVIPCGPRWRWILPIFTVSGKKACFFDIFRENELWVLFFQPLRVEFILNVRPQSRVTWRVDTK
jgi:hypothetical protein